MSLTLFPPRAPSRLGPQMPDLHLNTAQEYLPPKSVMGSSSTGASPITPASTSNAFDNRISVLPPLPTFASKSESRSGSPLRSATNSRQNSPTRAAQNLTPPPTIGLPPLPVDAIPVTKNGRPVSPNSKTVAITKGSYLAGAKMKAKETFMRRKGSMPEIQTSHVLAPEIPMDSPTIPGRPPMHDRQASLPASAFSHVFSEATMVKVPPPPQYIREHKRSASSAREVDMPKVLVHKRSESGLRYLERHAPEPLVLEKPIDMPIETPKLQLQTKIINILPSKSPNQPPLTAATTLINIPSPLEDLPPTVPPKDPKPSPLNVSRSINSRNRAGSEPQFERPARPNTLHKRQASAQEPHREPLRQKPSALPTLESHREVPKPKISVPTPEPPRLKPIATSAAAPSTSKRRSTANRTMPRGMRPVDVVKTLQPPVITSLQNAARKTCEKFAVLSPSEVDSLTAELAQLEERCEYLRRTHQSLRSGKKALHMKMLQHLRSDRSGSFSRETLLKQQEALADLDTSIDDWEAKMDRAETRRAQVHRKLLEHVAAALSVPGPSEATNTDTPPSTPEDRKSLDDRCQSIKVYALLADVEQEFGKMLKDAR